MLLSRPMPLSLVHAHHDIIHLVRHIQACISCFSMIGHKKMTAYICVSIIWDGSAYLNMYLMASKQFVSTVDTRYIKFTKLVCTGHSKQCHVVALLLNLVRAIYSSLSRLQEMNCKGKRVIKSYKKTRRF